MTDKNDKELQTRIEALKRTLDGPEALLPPERREALKRELADLAESRKKAEATSHALRLS
jgi:hypothetical protein